MESITTTVAGAFADETSFTAGIALLAECAGAECETLGHGYGAAFSYPCTAIAPFSGISGE